MNRQVANLSMIVALIAVGTATASAVTRNVNTSSALYSAVSVATAGDEIVLAAGTYNLWQDVIVVTPQLTIRGATGNCLDVVLVGGGMNAYASALEGIQIQAADVTIRDLTVSECYYHAIHFQNGANRALIRNVRTLNIGEQHMKGVPTTTGGVIEQCLMEQTKTRLNDGVSRPDNYVGGIDIISGSNWTIRDNIARNIKGIAGGDAAIFLWQNIYDCVTERNVLIGCTKGIAYGNPYNPTNIYHAVGGIIRNNFVVHRSGNDIGIETCFTKNLKVYNNTFYSEDPNFFRTFQIFASPTVPTVNLQLSYNIIRGNILSTNANGTWTSTGNIIGPGVAANWFWDPLNGNLHLARLAAPAIDQAALLTDVPADFDTQMRPIGLLPDIGADEFVAGDMTGDGHVNMTDLLALAATWGLSVGQAGYDAKADLTGDDSVDVIDLLRLAESWGL